MERMNHLKRIMAWVMTAAMLVSSCPTTAIADEVVSQVQKPVAQTLRSGETYGSLKEAYEAEFGTTTDETHMSFADRVRDVEKNGKDTLIYANLRPAQNAAQWKTGEVVPFTLSMTFQLATNLTEYRAFDLNSMTFDEYIRYRPFDSYDDIRLQISAPGNLRISATDNGGWTDTLNVDSVQSVVPADGSNAVTLNYTFFGRMIDNGVHADGDLITPTVSLSASITPKMHYYDKNGEEKVYAGTPIDYRATIRTNAFRNAAEAKTWDVQNEAVKHTVNGDEVTFTYQVRTGALGTQGEILRQNSDYVDHGVLDLSGYTLQETIQPVAGKNGAKVYPKQATVTLGDSAYTCDIVENEDGTRSLVMPANGGNTIHNTAALDGDNTVHPSVYAYNNYTVNLIYDKADFELDCDDERLDDAAFKGLGVTLDSTLNYTVYGDSDKKTADSSKTLYYHFVRQGGYILPEQYVKLAADVADRTVYSGSDAVFAIYKASEVTHNEKGELVLGENAKLSDRIGAFKTSRELPEGDYYVVRTGMEAGYTNVKPGDKKTIKIGEASYPYQLVTVKAGTKENAVKAEFEDYNAQNGQFTLEKKFYAPDGTQDTNSSLSAEFTLTAKNGRTYTVKVENGKPTTVYLPADTYTMKETGVSDGFVKADDKNVLIEAGRQTLLTDDNAVKNYSTEGLLNLKAHLREYEQGANLEADQSHYTVTITRDGETEPVKQTTLDEAESVYLPRFDGDGRLITYRVKVESNEQTDGLFYASSKNGEGEKPEAEIQITFTDDARIQNADYFFIKQQELTITKRLVDVSGLNKEQTWTITVQAACEAGDALPSRTVELTTDGEQNEASQTLSLRGWDENGHVVTYTVGEEAAEGYAVTYSEKSVTLDDGTDKTITVTNTRQVGKTTFTKVGSDNAILPGAVYAVLTRKADGKTYLVGRTPTDGVLTGKMEAIVDGAERLTQQVEDEYRFTTDKDGRIELVLPVEEGTSYYLQELEAPENYYLNTKLVRLTVAAGDDSQKAGQVDRRKYQLEVTKDFPAEAANDSFATFTLYDETKQQVGDPVTVRKPDQAVGVFTIPAYGTYYVRETAVSGDMMLNDTDFGPLTYSETDRADNLTVPNKANVGSLTVELRDEKKEKLGTQPAAIDYVSAADLAEFTVSVGASNLEEDSYAYQALLKTGFVLDKTTNTLVYTGEKGASRAFKLSSLPIYGDPNDKNTALTYTVKQEQAAQRYFKAEDVQQFKLNENASQTLTFENEPKAALNVSLNYQKEYELERGNAPEYPLTGATMTLYEVKDDGTLEQVESINMTNPTATISDLHGLKHYVLVETKVPDGYCAYESKDSVHAHSENAAYNREPHDYQDVLKNFKYVELTGEETDNQNDSQSSITNYKDYVQLKLNKIGYTVQFADGATEGVVVGETQPLDYCQFEVYAIRTSDLKEEQRELLARNSKFEAPQAGQKVEKGTYTGREAELEAIFTAEPQMSKLITDGITYETGASGMGTGAFMTDAFELDDDVDEYTFLFREVKINHAGGYQKVYGGVWSAAATEVNAVTEVDAYNEADVVSGGETEFKGLFQVKLDKEYWPSTEAKDNNRVGELKPLAGVTFELLLARENANGLLEAVKGRGAFSTEFVTGCESGMSAGYGVSITVSLETLYTENGGADNPDNPVKLDKDENGQPFYEADFILREKDYPINMVYMQERYALHVKAVKNAQDADYVTVVDDYLNKDGQHNAIKNILGEMTYLTVAKYVDGERYYGGERSTDAVYTITDAKGKVYTHVKLNNANHYETTVQLPRQTTFTIEETTAPVIEGVQTDKSGFVFDGENVNGTSANRLTFTTGEYKSQIAVCSTNTRFHSLTVIKRDADEKLVKGAPIQIGYSDGKSAVLSSNGSALANTRQTTNEKGEVIFSLPIWDYRTSEAGNYPKAKYAIAETLDETPVAEYWNPNAVVNRYFKLLNGGKLTIAGADVEADEPITVYNPATTSVTIHKVSDRSGETTDLKPIAAYFALYFCPFKSQDEFEGRKLNYPKSGYVYLPHTGTTDAETGEITFDGLYSGWYLLVETIPQGQVNAGQLFTTWFRVICDKDYEHLDKSGKNKSYTSEVQLLASETLKNRFDAGRQDANNSVTITNHTIDVTNTPRAYLEITKTFEPSQTQSIPESVAFYVYKKGTTEAAELEMRVVDAHGTESWQKVARQPITLGGFTETERSQSVVVRLDPGEYTVVESTDESAGYWFAKSAAYLNGKPETPVYNGTTVANGRIISSRNVTVTRYNAMDVQRQMKVDFVNVGTLMAGQIEKTKCLSESETPTALENCSFSLYTRDKQNNKRYYAGRESGTPFGDWTGTRENAARFKSGADGMVQLNEVYAPEDAMTDGTSYTYWVEEISAPDYSYQLAYDAKIDDLAAGSVAKTISMVNTRGVSIQVRVFGSVRSNRDDDTPVVEGAVLHIMKKDAKGKLREVLLSDGQPYLYQTVTSDANGDVLFPYLPRLEEGEAYVVFEQPDAGAIGDDPTKPYLNPVSRGYKAYYDFKKTDANHSRTAEQDVSELDGAAGYYTVVTGEELMANPNELFSTLHFNAYNEPKGRLVILKRDYENRSALVGGAKFSAAETDGTDETHSYAFADLEPTAADRTEAPQTLEIGEKTYTLAKDRTYYTDKQGYRYTYVITSYVERGSYAFAETTTPAGYIETEASQSAGMPWHTEAEAVLTNEGGFAAAAFANIPNRDPYLDKTVSAVNGEADGKLGNLQNTQADGSWQTVTFEIRKTTSDSGAADANDAIRYPMNSFVITDNKVEYQTVDAHGNKSGWLDGGAKTVQTQHFVESVTVGKMSFAQLEEAYGTAAEGDRIYADVYGMIGTQETLIQSDIDVTGSSADVSLKAEDGGCIYTGFKIAYHMRDSRDIPAGLRQDTPIVVTMRFHQESGEAINRVCGVRNTAGLNLAYAIGAKSQASVSKTYTDAANCDADSSIGLPKARITKQVQRAEIVQNPNTGDYVVTVEAEATNPKSKSLTVSAGSGAHYTIVFENISGQAENLPAIEAPILVDTLPRQAMAVKAEARSDNAALKLTTTVSQDGYTVVVRGDGRLEAGQKITLTVDALFVGERILEQIIAHNTGMDANIAYAMSGVQTVKNTKNPFGVPFVDEAGNEITGMVKQQPGDSQSGELPGFEGQHGISAKAEHRSAEPSALTISKYVAGTITGKNKFVSGSNVAVTGAKTEKDNEINRIYYRILVENPSLSPAANVAVMDELPHTDDWRNDSSTRDSKWDVALESTAIRVTKYAADGSSTELKPGEDYTVYFTQKKITSQNRNTYNDYFGADNIRKSWATSMAPADVHGFAVMLTQPLAGKERVLIEYTCSAPEVTDSSVYFTTANNIARLSYDQHSGVASDVARVAIIPEKVWLGNRVWIDFNGDGIQSEDLSVEPNYAYTGEGKQLTMQLSQRYNRYRPTTQTQTITDGSYQFNELFAAVKLASLKNDPNDSDGNVVATNLSGSERYTYQLTLSGIPKSFMVTRKSVNNPIASDKDSDFVADGNGGAATKWFYLPVPTEEMVKNNQLGYPQVDVGLVPVRNLEITKEADNDADVSDAVFAIYGPYTTEELDNLTAVSAAKKVGKMTSSGNVYSFVSTQSAYLTYADSYLVVETSAPAPYLSTGATFSGEGIAAHDEVEIGGEKHSCFVLEGMNTLPGDFKADSRKTYRVSATDLYSAAGTYMLTAQKKVFAEGTQVELERYANLFRIWVTSPDDPNLTKRVAAGGNVTVEENAVFVQADENGKFDLTMNYATIPETGWTQRDWEGMTYTYQIEEVDTAFDGVTYDETKYTVTVTLEDDGQGHLTPNAKISGGEDGSIVLKNELARRDLTISKTTAGNKVLSDDAFTVKIVLSRKDIVPVDGDYPMMDGAAETTLTVKNGEATLKIRDGQTVTIKDIPVGTTYTVEETDERAQGYNIDASAYTSGGSGVIATEAKVELKNVRNAGSLTIRKKIEGKDPISEREFSFTAAITYPAGVNLEDKDNLPKIPMDSQMTVEDRTVTIKDIRIAVSQTKPDVNVTIDNILYGASYTVTENDGFAEWGYAAYYDEDKKFGESTPNRVVNAENQTALFTNVRSAGKLKIGKTATGTGVGKGLAAGTETYNVTLTLENETVSLDGHVGRSNMPSEGEKTTYPVKQKRVGQAVTLRLSLHNGEVVTFEDLPEGTKYAVVEDEQPYRDMGFTVSYADGNSSTTEKNKGKISKETASSVQITNVRDTHSVSITKNVLGQMANEGDAFDFNVRIEKKDDALSDEAVYREYTYTVNGQTATIDFRRRDVQTISLKKGETAVIDDVPDGADIIVTEAMSEKHEDEGYTLKTAQTEINEKPNIIGYTFTNERYIGSIEITKALAGTGSDKGCGKTFTFDVKLWNEHDLDLLNARTSTMPSGVVGLTKTNEQRDGHDVYAGTVSITMGADGQPVSASITNIPAHTCYEIVEHNYTDDGYTTQTPQNAFGIIDVVNEAGREEAMTFTNTRESGTLALSKALKGNATDGEKAFTFRVKLENARFDTATQRDAYDVVIREANKADVQTTVARDANGEYVLTLKGGQTATLLDVLYGTTATVAEDDYTAEGYEAVSTQTAAVNGQTPDAAAAFTNERNVGVLSVTKNAVGNAVKFEKNGRAVFSFSATLTYADWIDLTQTNNLPTVDGKTPKNMTVDAKNHTVTLSLSIPVTEAARVGSLTVENILKGTRYAVREMFDAQDGYYLTVSTQNGRVNGSEVTGTIADALTGDAVFTNTRNVGALEITKKLEGTGYNDRVAVSNAVRTSFGFTVRLWREDGVRLTGDNRPTLNGKALTLETRTENGFTYDEAHVTVDMADGAAATGEERGVTIGNILVDTHYTVIEDENGYQTEGYVVRQGEQGGVMTDAGDTLRFVNTRDTGSLEIVKNLDGRTAEFGREFEFTVTLSRNDNIALAGTYLTQSGRTVAFEDNATGGVTARVRVAGGGSLTILGIPSGTSYTVSEADYTADRYTTTSTGAVGVVETAAVRATFLNTRANPGYGTLTVTKTVEAIGGAEIPDTQFVFDIALTLEDGEDFTGTLRTTRTSGETGRLYFNGGAASIRLSHGESVTLSGIPLGTSYTVTERAAQDMRVSSTGSEGVIKGTGHMAAFVNTMTQAYTDLIVRKAWNDANDAQKLRPQSVTVDVTRNGQTITTLTLNAANRWTQTLTQLPMFDDNGEAYDYDVVENDVPEGYTASVVTRGTTFTVINTHRIDDGFVPVDPENRRRGGLTILDDLGVPLGGGINMNEGDCFN